MTITVGTATGIGCKQTAVPTPVFLEQGVKSESVRHSRLEAIISLRNDIPSRLNLTWELACQSVVFSQQLVLLMANFSLLTWMVPPAFPLLDGPTLFHGNTGIARGKMRKYAVSAGSWASRCRAAAVLPKT